MSRVEVPVSNTAPARERDLVQMVVDSATGFEDAIGREFRERCMNRYRQYRGFKQFADTWVAAPEADKDEILRESKENWGASLHIPLSFRTIETMVPRAIAQRPRMLVLPRKQEYAANARPMRQLLDVQQDQIDIDLAFQAVMRSGHIYGIGAGKTFWKTKKQKRRPVKRRTFKRDSFFVGKKLEEVVVFDDPMFEDVDIFDLMWDEYGHDVNSCGWMIHRSWLSTRAIVERIQDGTWATETAQNVKYEEVARNADGVKYDEVWQERLAASGFTTATQVARGDAPHEVLEWHDGERVMHVIDRKWLMQEDENACLGTKALQVYRPTPLQKQMVGIGDLEPLEHLQRELDTLRSQRRDAATLILAGAFAFDESAVDRDDLIFGPGAAIPVQNARPGDALQKLQFGDLPGSGYQEEAAIRADFEAVSGLQDGLDSSPGGTAGTATEAQLVRAALGARIELGARRFEIEIVRQSARAFLRYNQRMILKEREYMLPDHRQLPDAQYGDVSAWLKIGPQQLMGEFEVMAEGGSMAQRNVPQDRQDAMQFFQMSQNPQLDPRRPLIKGLELMGIEDPESWLAAGDKPVPPAALEMLKQALGPVHAPLVDFAVQQAQAQDPRLAPQPGPSDGSGQMTGPTVPDVNAMMGAQS